MKERDLDPPLAMYRSPLPITEVGGLQAQLEKAGLRASGFSYAGVSLVLGPAGGKRLPTASHPGPRADVMALFSGGWGHS